MLYMPHEPWKVWRNRGCINEVFICHDKATVDFAVIFH